ncbi:LuxR C-terminal-related transcriptional regulator [[Actinomadura] parvosata]|uniref:LuxR C-terminal-related transcriptional regulator n=1 Tax=[Actinomadura] parvosata TaxID=1955412 RepID=UPI00406C7F25
MTELARRAGRDPATVHRLTGGNPLLVTELLASEGTAVPAMVQDLVLDRLRSLPEPARELARLVSVLPTRADAAVVAGAADLVETCVDAGVLVPSGDGVAFRHELLRGAVEESLSPARRAAAHRRVLGVLARTPGVDPGRLVHHALNAGDAAAVLRYGQLAGAGAARQGAHREAAAHYRAAVEHADGLPAERRAELLEAYAEQAYLAGLAEEALRARQAALELREAEGRAGPVGENLRWISRLAWWAGRREQAWDAAARLVTVLEDGDPQLAMAYSNQSQLHMAAHHLDEAVAWGERATKLADRLGDVAASVHAEINVSTARLVRGEAGATAALRAAHERAEAAGLADHAARALVVLATGPVQLAEYGVAARALEEALAYAAGRNLDGYVQYLLGVRAVVRVEGCDWDGALADAEASLALAVKGGVARFPALLARGRILAARGDAGAAALLEEAARQAERTGEPQRVGPVTAARCEHLLWSGDAEGAREEAGRGLGLAVSVRHPVYAGELALRRWLAGGERRAPSCAAAPYRMMIGGEWAAAAEWERRGALYTRLWALALGEQGEPVEALRTLDGLGAARAAQWLRGELRRRGFTRIPRGPRRATSANAAGLTPRQADVLALLAEGLSNAEIASRLCLSAKTVDHHISAVLAKLGVASRGQAAALAHRMNERGEAAI